MSRRHTRTGVVSYVNHIHHVVVEVSDMNKLRIVQKNSVEPIAVFTTKAYARYVLDSMSAELTKNKCASFH
jgi:hypothetical protein